MKKNSIATPHGEQAEVDERHAAAPCQPVLEAQEAPQQQRHGTDHEPGPWRPALLAALRERQDQAGERGRRQRHPAEIEARAMDRAGFRHRKGGADYCHHPDRNIEQEHRTPAKAPGTERDQKPTAELPGHQREAHHHAIDAERPRQLAVGVKGADCAQHLRRQHRCSYSLQSPGDHQQRRRARQATERRGCRKSRHSRDKQTLAAKEIAKPAARDQKHRVSRGIAGNHQLHRGSGRVQAVLDRGRCDIDDGEINRRQKAATQEHQQGEPARDGRGRRRRRTWGHWRSFLFGGRDVAVPDASGNRDGRH